MGVPQKVVALRFSESCGQTRILGVLSSLDITRKCTKAGPLFTSSNVPPFVIATCIGYLYWLSKAQVRKDKPSCLRLLTQVKPPERERARAKAGSMSKARTARHA